MAACIIDPQVNAEALSGLSLAELRHLSDGIRTLRDVATALTCQLRFEGDLSGGYNAAGEQMDAIHSALSASLDAIRNAADKRAAPDRAEAEHRANLIIVDEAQCFDDFDGLVDLASTLRLDIAVATERGEIAR